MPIFIGFLLTSKSGYFVEVESRSFGKKYTGCFFIAQQLEMAKKPLVFFYHFVH